MSEHGGGTRMSDEEWYEEDLRLLAGVQKLRFFPQVVAQGEGSLLSTPDGKELVDLSASWTAVGLGLGHPSVAAAIAEAAQRPPGGSLLSGTHPDAVRLAREILELVPSRGDERQVYLGHAGTDANDVAITAARRATGRQRIIAFRGGYHGGLGSSRGVSGVHVEAGAAADVGLTLVDYPDPYRPWGGVGQDLLERTLAEVERELAGDDVAAIIVEPIQCDGGVVVPPKGFLSGLRVLADEHGALLIVDEVKVGLGRTGRLWAHQAEGVLADVVTLGKALGNGVPVSAVVAPARLLEAPTASALMTTVGNPVSCAAARAVLGVLRDGVLADRARTLGLRAVELLKCYTQSGRPGAAAVGDVRGEGLLIGVELVRPGLADPDPALAARACLAGWERGVVLYPVRGNVLEITPALTIDEEQLDTGLYRVLDALDAAMTGGVTDEDVAAYAGW